MFDKRATKIEVKRLPENKTRPITLRIVRGKRSFVAFLMDHEAQELSNLLTVAADQECRDVGAGFEIVVEKD